MRAYTKPSRHRRELCLRRLVIELHTCLRVDDVFAWGIQVVGPRG